MLLMPPAWGEAPLAQIAKDFGLSVKTLMRWTTIADYKESGPARRWFRPRYGSGRSAIVYCSRRIRFCVGRLTIWPETPTQMIYPLASNLAADTVPVGVICRMLSFSKQGYYHWKASPVSERDWIGAHMKHSALDIHADDPAFRCWLIADKLRENGITRGEYKVQRPQSSTHRASSPPTHGALCHVPRRVTL